MPIRIRRDDPSEPLPQEEPDRPEIVVQPAPAAERPAPAGPEAKRAGWSDGAPSQTSWAMVSCRCTVSGASYQLAFRREAGAYVLRSVDRGGSAAVAKDLDGLKGPFDWTAFECPDYEASWSRYRKRGLYVILCSCNSLFCGSEESKTRGLRKLNSGSGDKWWWLCPECQTEQPVEIGLEAMEGQAVKGK